MTDASDAPFQLPHRERFEIERLIAEIPFDVAQRAHAGTSMSPEVRARQEQEGFATTIHSDWKRLEEQAGKLGEESISDLVCAFAAYHEGYRDRYLARLSALSRCLSSMITGPSNFPTRRNAKANDAAEKRTTELIEYRNAALARMRRLLHPEDRPIMSGDDDAVQRLRAKLAEAEQLQAKMSATNAAIRKHKKAGEEAQVAALIALGHAERIARTLLQPDELRRIGYASYQLTNNNANIRRMRERLEELTKAKATEATEVQGEHARFEDNPADNRVRIFFPGKPSEQERSALKSAGFRWTPSLECWQAYRNERTIAIAKRKAGIQEAATPHDQASTGAAET